MGTTPPDLTLGAVNDDVLALPVVRPPALAEPVDLGDSDSAPLPEVGVVTGVWAREFLREDFLEDRDAVPLTGAELPLPRFRFLMTSVLSDNGRTTPCSFKKRPQALHSGWPSGLRRHRGVVCVKQLVQVVGALLGSPGLMPPGLCGRDGAAELKPDSGGEFGED